MTDSTYSPLQSETSSRSGKSTTRKPKLLCSLLEDLKNIYQPVLEDLRAIGWKRAAKSLFLFLWLGGILAAFIYIAMLPSASVSNLDGCLPDGEFSPFYENFDWWTKSGFFQITLLAVKRTSFSAAKAIDAAWDVIIGRGGQTILAWLSWHVFSEFLIISMAAQPITYITFWVIFLQKEGSLTTMCHLIREFVFVRCISSRLAACFIVWTLSFILLFPTLASSMTGYTPVVEAYLTLRSGSMERFSQVVPVAYIIHDGSRIHLSDDYAVPFTASDGPHDELISKNTNTVPGICSRASIEYDKTSDLMYGCNLQSMVSEYVKEYGFYGLNKTDTKWNDTFNLNSPALDIEAFYIPESDMFYGNTWKNIYGTFPFSDKTKVSYVVSETIYDLSYIVSNGSCQPIRNEFHWGFSYLQLFVFMLLLLLWSIGLFIMWLKAHLTIKTNRHQGAFEGWKGLIILSQAFEKEFKQHSIDVHTLTDKQLERAIRKVLQGGSVESETGLPKGTYSFYAHAVPWLKREKLWSAIFMISLVYVILGIFFFPILLPFSVYGCFSVLLGLRIGRTSTSKGVLAVCSWIAIGMPMQIIFVVAWAYS